MIDGRPNPDDLLASLKTESQHRGRLKIFLGASAGVGKTYAMLSEAHEQLRRGVDVVIGVIVTHGRIETEALTEGLESVPLKPIDYRGSAQEELNVEGIVSRRPELALVDELAHTNVPGSRHKKRWLDIEDLLEAGIDVYTAVNIQHLESLNEVVAQVTGVRVQETVPDAFIEQANEIELIDIPAAELRQRLKEGKVYVPERIDHALEGFFKTSNLTALRELALRRAADTVDAEMRRLRVLEGATGPWATRERVIVCIAPNRLALRVVRAAARLGAASHAEMIAVNVESDRQRSRTPQELAAAQEAMELATQLGMEVITLQGHDIVAELLNLAHRRNANLVVVGKPIRSRWKEVLFGSVVDQLVRASGDVDVHVITAEVDPRERPAVPTPGGLQWTISGLAMMGVATTVATAVGFALFEGFGVANVAMVYLLSVSLLSTRCTRTESVIAAVVNVLTFNFFFVEPRFTFAVSDIRYLLLFMVMLVVALVISTLTHRLRGQLVASSERERRTASLYHLSRQLAQGRGKKEMADAAAKEVRDVFDGDVAVFLSQEGKQVVVTPSETGFEDDPHELAVAHWSSEHGEPAGRHTETLPGAKALHIPLRGSEVTVGVLAFKPNDPAVTFAQRQLLETFANSLGLAIERAVLAKASNDARVAAETERIRSTLLSSISHDLRTPLTSITGAASTLREGAGDPKMLAEAIFSESARLNHQIQNLLDMTKLQSGGTQLDRNWHAVDELVASAIRVTGPILGNRQVEIAVPATTPLLYVDGLLIEKALINLLDNAGRHTPEETVIRIVSDIDGARIKLTVADDGRGLDQEQLEELFGVGQQSATPRRGLGLAIVKAIMDLHAGEVLAGNNSAGGACFTLALPLPPSQPETPRE